MTKFLEQALARPGEDSVNRETDRLFAYHHATKHTYDSVRATPHFLDWRNQPDPFRVYHGACVIPLAKKPDFPAAGTFETIAALAEASTGKASTKVSPIRLDATWLSRLLWHSMAISAWKQVPQTNVRYSLRVNPSSGNLHPTETHLALRGFQSLDDGLYHYRADAHALEQRGRGDWVGQLAEALALPWAARAPLIVALTSVFWREAWKYRDRAYRYCCHDLGHALVSLLVAAQALGLPGGVVAHFSDARLVRTLQLAHTDEAPLAFLIFGADAQAVPSHLDYNQTAEPTPGIPNELSEEEVPCYLLLGMHRSTVLPEPAPPIARAAEETSETGKAEPLPPPESDAPLGVVVRRRRSALDFDPRTPPMEASSLEQLLDFATRDWQADWRGNFSNAAAAASAHGRDFAALYIYAHRIRALVPGVYRWSTLERRLEPLQFIE